jgi:predicted nucleotidyltransferase
MRRDEALAVLRANEDTLRQKYYVQSLELFGSVVRDEALPGSDVDLLVEFDRPISLFDLVDTGLFLERVLRVPKVDLVIRHNVIPELREVIYGEAVHVFDSEKVETPHPARA